MLWLRSACNLGATIAVCEHSPLYLEFNVYQFLCLTDDVNLAAYESLASELGQRQAMEDWALVIYTLP